MSENTTKNTFTKFLLKTENKSRKLDKEEVIDKDGEKHIRRELEKTKMFVNN